MQVCLGTNIFGSARLNVSYLPVYFVRDVFKKCSQDTRLRNGRGSFAPLRTWRAQAQGRNVMGQREGHVGVFIAGAEGRHAPRAVAGAFMPLDFVLVDERRRRSGAVYRVEV